jgi:tetratricopeptide (TPR) repeat protein
MYDQSRAEFERAKASSQKSEMKTIRAYAIAGLADCDLFELRDLDAAEAQYKNALELSKETKNESATSWVTMGLGDVCVLKDHFSEAKGRYLESPLHGNSVSGLSRIHLGLARATLALGELDDAEFHIGAGFACTGRLDYQFRREQFEDLRKQLAMKRENTGQ